MCQVQLYTAPFCWYNNVFRRINDDQRSVCYCLSMRKYTPIELRMTRPRRDMDGSLRRWPKQVVNASVWRHNAWISRSWNYRTANGTSSRIHCLNCPCFVFCMQTRSNKCNRPKEQNRLISHLVGIRNIITISAVMSSSIIGPIKYAGLYEYFYRMFYCKNVSCLVAKARIYVVVVTRALFASTFIWHAWELTSYCTNLQSTKFWRHGARYIVYHPFNLV